MPAQHFSTDKQLNKIIAITMQTGEWNFETGKKHNKLRHKQGGMVTVAKSPSCHHAYKNLESDIRKVANAAKSNMAPR